MVLQRSRSTPGLNELMNQGRPNWARSAKPTKPVSTIKATTTDNPSTPVEGTANVVLDASKRPAPVKTIKVKNLKSHRTPRDPPSGYSLQWSLHFKTTQSPRIMWP